MQRQQPPPRPQKPIEPEPAPQPEPEPEPEPQQAEYEQQDQYDQQQYGEEGAYESQGQEAYDEDYAIEQPGQHDYEQESWISQEQEEEQQQQDVEGEPQRSPAVPELSFEAPSPEFRAQPDHAEEPPLDELDGEVDTQQQQQQQYQAEPEIYINENGEQEDDYFEEHLGAKKTGVESGASTPPAARSSGAAGVEEYGFDDSAVFDGGMSTSTSGSTYGEWTGQSDAHDGYDYVQDDHAGQQQEGEYDPYAAPSEGNESPYGLEDEQDRYGPNDIPSRESTYTPPSRSASNFGSPSKPTSTLPATDNPSTSTSNNVPYASAPYASAPPPAPPVDSYAHYPQAPPSSDPFLARVDGNQTAPASYGAYDSGSTYSPYGAAGGPRQSSEERSAPYDPYSKTLTRQMSTTSLASTGAVPCDLDLERCSAPVVSFGFGGRMLLVFPNGGQTPYSVDTMPYGASPSTSAAPSSPSTVHIRKLDDIVSPPETAVWPGPIYLDGGKANAGKKRKEAVGWLDQRTEELEKEVGYAQGVAPTGFGGETAVASKRKLETRLTLVKLVKVLVENEGKLGGS